MPALGDTKAWNECILRRPELVSNLDMTCHYQHDHGMELEKLCWSHISEPFPQSEPQRR